MTTMVIRTAIAAAAVAGLAVQAGAASATPHIYSISRTLPTFGARPFGVNPFGARPFASSNTFYTFGGTLAATQWRTWFKSSAGCYAASGTGAAQSAFLGGGLGPTTETVTAPQTADCVSPNNGSIKYPEVDFSAGDAPLSTAQNNTYKSSSTYSKRGLARVTPVAGASLSEAFNTSGLPANLTISNAQLCSIWKGTIKNWDGVTNQATGKPASATSLPLSLVYRSDGSGSTFIHTAHLNTICGGYGPVGTSFPVAAAGSATLIGAVGSGGVAAAIAANKGSIGYVAPNSLVSGETSAAIENKSGQYYTPTTAAITAAFTSPTDSTPPSGYPAPIAGQQVDLYLTNPSASGSYGEVGFTYAFVYTCYPTAFGVPASKLTSFFDGVVYKSGSVTQVGLVNLSNTIAGDGKIVIGGVQSGSSYNPNTKKCS